MASLAKNVVWGSSPTNYFNFSYTKQRSGTTQQYKITVSCQPCTGASYFGYPIYLSISLDGTTKVSAYTLKAASPSRWSSAIEYTTGWLSVSNKVSGTTALSIRIYSGSGSTRDTTYKYTLPIDVTTSTVSATNANIGGKSTITIKRMNSSLTHTLEYKMDGQSSYTSIATKTASTSISWTVPTSAYALVPSAKKIGITIRCTTYSGSTAIGSDTCEIEATTTDASSPSVSVTAEDVDANTLALTGNSKKIIAGYSDVEVTATVSAKNSASITGTTLKCGTSSASGTSKTFTDASSNSISATAKDSRGYSTTAKASGLTLIKYIEPTVNVTVTRSSPTSDTVTVTAKGNYFNGSFGAVANTLAVQLRYKPKSQSAYEDTDLYHTMTATISGNTYTATLTLSGFEYTQQYSLRVRVTDKIHKYGGPLAEAAYCNTEIKKGIPVFDWGENDFKFNVPVNIEGCGTFPGDGWKTISLGSQFESYDADDPPVYRKVGNLVEISGTVTPTAEIAGSADKYTICTLPAGYRPVTPLGIMCQGSSIYSWFLHISPAGAVTFSRHRDLAGYKEALPGTWLGFHCMFFV